MILKKKTEIKTSKKNEIWLKSKGYEFITGEIIDIKTEDINPGSHLEIDVKCDVCDNEKKLSFQKYIKNINNGGFYACCSKCSQEKVKKTSKEKFGSEYYMQTDEYKQRHKETCLEKYGVEHHTQNILVKDKQKETMLERYGVECYTQTVEYKENYKKLMLEKFGVENSFQSDEIKVKSKKTMREKYGVDYFTQSNLGKTKIKDIVREKYGVDNISQSEEIKDKKKQTSLINYGVENIFSDKCFIEKNKIKHRNYIKNKVMIENIDVIDITNDYNYIICCEYHGNFEIQPNLYRNRKNSKTIICPMCNPVGSFSSSGKEIQLINFIKENYEGEIIENTRNIISPLELDIYLPELKLAFEFNGLYWHSELYKDKNYHILKTESCLEKGIQLLHIWEDDWDYKQDIVKSMILNKLGKTANKIFARKTEIKVIDDNFLIKNFLNDNHIQGYLGSSVKLGLFYNDELVSVMTFGKKRNIMKSKSKEGEFELLRFCNKLNTNVIGGASKLFKYFIKNYSYTEIITYTDRSHSQGKLYETLGFNFTYKTESNYYYVVDGIRKHRFVFRKDILVKEGYDVNKTEHEIMLERNLYRIYNAGNLKFIFNI
jgi:hypothetical protein